MLTLEAVEALGQVPEGRRDCEGPPPDRTHRWRWVVYGVASSSVGSAPERNQARLEYLQALERRGTYCGTFWDGDTVVDSVRRPMDKAAEEVGVAIRPRRRALVVAGAAGVAAAASLAVALVLSK